MTFIAAQFWFLRNKKHYTIHRNTKFYVNIYECLRDSLLIPCYLSRVDHVRKIRDRKQRNDVGKYSFVNRTIKNWSQLPAEAIGIFRCKHKFLETELGQQL